jgi:hypothetical protein
MPRQGPTSRQRSRKSVSQKQLPLLIEEAPPADFRGGAIDSLTEAERLQGSHAIRRQVDPRPDGRPCRAAFNELRRKALPVQRGRDCKTRYSAADDQDPLNVGHVSSFAAASGPNTWAMGAAAGLRPLLSNVHV